MSLHVKNISGGYGKKIVCNNISFSMKKGDVTCIVGPNGAGKTTLIKLILGLLKNSSGDILLEDDSIVKYEEREKAKIIAYVPQHHTMQFSLTAFEMVLMGRTSYIPALSFPKKNDELLANEALKKLHIDHLANASYDTLSGGQKQMVLIARALCQSPRILVMDEPTSNLDYYNQTLVINTIKKLATNGLSILITSHNLSQPFLYANNTLILQKGKAFAFGKTQEVLTPQNLTSVYELPMDVITAQDSNGNSRYFCVPL